MERHAAAHRVAVDLVFGRRELHLRVRDDGVGFLSGQPLASLGLLCMQERAAQLGGRLEPESRPSEGTLVIPTGHTRWAFAAPFAIGPARDPKRTPAAIRRHS